MRMPVTPCLWGRKEGGPRLVVTERPHFKITRQREAEQDTRQLPLASAQVHKPQYIHYTHTHKVRWWHILKTPVLAD